MQSLAQIVGGIKENQKMGLVSDCQVLDLKQVTISKQELIDDEIPMLFILCQVDELQVYKNKKGEVIHGSYTDIISANYVFALTQREFAEPPFDDQEESVKFDPKTGGWCVVEWVKHQSRF